MKEIPQWFRKWFYNHNYDSETSLKIAWGAYNKGNVDYYVGSAPGGLSISLGNGKDGQKSLCKKELHNNSVSSPMCRRALLSSTKNIEE